MRTVQLIIIFAFTLMVLAVASIYYLGFWGLLLDIVAFIALSHLLKRLARKLLLKFVTAPFRIKGAVLKDANVRVLSITPASAPARSEMVDSDYGDSDFEGSQVFDSNAAEVNQDLQDNADQGDTQREWYYLDVTITPTQTEAQMQFWEPSELVLVDEDATANMDDMKEAAGTVHSVQIWQNGSWHSDDPGKYAGPQRLKLYAGIKPDERDLRFRYYFEIFGRIEIPSQSWPQQDH